MGPKELEGRRDGEEDVGPETVERERNNQEDMAQGPEGRKRHERDPTAETTVSEPDTEEGERRKAKKVEEEGNIGLQTQPRSPRSMARQVTVLN
ncbi:hypothetical protein NDU88_003227 [Pleurodeles waltl]|uniref:Uncharacterized protein n=1 Tax=Pleurodeles waltl TaxID=8319 RepID=A0AAV7RDA7_PLEWA|nr:hypothetical protein NDU88_003227 [Pleurodeles waltl]